MAQNPSGTYTIEQILNACCDYTNGKLKVAIESDITMPDTKAIRTGTSDGDYFTLDGYDVDGAAYTPLLKVEAGNTPKVTVLDNLYFDDAADRKIYYGTSERLRLRPTDLLILNKPFIFYGQKIGFDAGGTDGLELGGQALGAGAVHRAISRFSKDNMGADLQLCDMPVTSAAAAGVEQSYVLAIDADPIFKVYAESDGAGGIQNQKILLPYDIEVDGITYLDGGIDDEYALLRDLHKENNFINVPTNTGWTTDNAGSGGVLEQPFRQLLYTGVTANSRALVNATAFGFVKEDSYQVFDWTRKTLFCFNYSRYLADGSTGELIGRVQLKSVTTEGVLANKGIGIQLTDYGLIFESYGTARGTIDPSITLTDIYCYEIMIEFDPTVPSIKYYVDGVLVGTETTVANIPSGVGGAFFVHSFINGATGGTSCYSILMLSKILQEKT